MSDREEMSDLSYEEEMSDISYASSDVYDQEETSEISDQGGNSLLLEACQLIEENKMERMRVDHCKAYLRKHKVRLSGKKQELLERIRLHIKLRNVFNQTTYARRTFTVNCKGDACVGDVVIFKQRVYDKYDSQMRSSALGCLGIRNVAGRIVKESYGAGKQQHTFTIEVFWSTGVKPLACLQQLLIKGRNLYRINILRQLWENEDERLKVLDEKHKRGDEARRQRAAAKQEKCRRFGANGSKKFHRLEGRKRTAF